MLAVIPLLIIFKKSAAGSRGHAAIEI